MAKTHTAVGIDVGSDALKAVMLRKRGTSHVSLLRAGSIELGDLAFLDDSPRKDARVGELLRTLVRKARLGGRRAASGLAGRDYFAKFLPVPPAPPDKLRRLIQYEVAEDPTSALGQQTSDFWLLDLPTTGEEFTVFVALARNDALQRRLRILRRGGYSARGLTLNAIGLFNTYVHTLDEGIFNDQTTLLVDMGARHMEVVVQRNAKIFFIRNLTLGGLRFSEALQEEFHLPIRDAEALKLTQGAILPRHMDIAAEIDADTPDARISAALLDPADTIYDTLQSTINYCKAQTRLRDLRIDRIVLSGRAARLRGLREFIAQRFRLPVDMLDPFAGLDTTTLRARGRDEILQDSSSYAVATGLALRQFDEGRAQPISLLPGDVRRRREFLARDAFLYAGAAIFLLAFGAILYSSNIAAASKEEDALLTETSARKGDAAILDVRDDEKRNKVLAGQAEALKRLFDTGRRCADAIAILKKRTPPQLRIDSITTVTESPQAGPRRRRTTQLKLTTHLLVEGTVAEKDRGEPIDIATAQRVVNRFLDRVLEEKHLYSSAKVTKVPHPREPASQRTFKMEVYFAAPFYGGAQEGPRRP